MHAVGREGGGGSRTRRIIEIQELAHAELDAERRLADVTGTQDNDQRQIERCLGAVHRVGDSG